MLAIAEKLIFIVEGRAELDEIEMGSTNALAKTSNV